MLGLASGQWKHELFSATEHGERVLRIYDVAVWTLLLPVLVFGKHLHGWLGAVALVANSLAYGAVALAIINVLLVYRRRSRGAG